MVAYPIATNTRLDFDLTNVKVHINHNNFSLEIDEKQHYAMWNIILEKARAQFDNIPVFVDGPIFEIKYSDKGDSWMQLMNANVENLPMTFIKVHVSLSKRLVLGFEEATNSYEVAAEFSV